MFIAFDGIDGVGKSTQVKFLEDFFKNKSMSCEVIDFGGCGKFKNILKSINNNKIEASSIVRELIYYFEGLYTNLEIVQPKKHNDIVIIDRYYLTYFAYGQLNGLTRDDISFFTKHLIEPDYYFYIDLPPDKACQLPTTLKG